MWWRGEYGGWGAGSGGDEDTVKQWGGVGGQGVKGEGETSLPGSGDREPGELQVQPGELQVQPGGQIKGQS